jgi:hypothetical protein
MFQHGQDDFRGVDERHLEAAAEQVGRQVRV